MRVICNGDLHPDVMYFICMPESGWVCVIFLLIPRNLYSCIGVRMEAVIVTCNYKKIYINIYENLGLAVFFTRSRFRFCRCIFTTLVGSCVCPRSDYFVSHVGFVISCVLDLYTSTSPTKPHNTTLTNIPGFVIVGITPRKTKI